MGKRIATVLGAAAAALMLTATTASADTIITDEGNFIYWERTCDTSYAGTVSKTKATTAKGNDGSCAGHAWVRALRSGSWTKWEHGSTSKSISSSTGKITKAQHKGCEKCTPYTTEIK
ncbi:hypothetical protein [Streptomyces sp. NPDC007929]|uniref:hypothetical protein n=1 Tax=unclassified Streptomyces TaxID=2593676 RepID=UPI0036E258A7